MNILYIENNFICERDVINAFDTMGFDIHLFPAPSENKSEQEYYLQQLLIGVRSFQAEFIFSTGFFPFLSLACSVMQIPYVTWLVEDYHCNHKNMAICNDWNFVFTADSILYKELIEAGVKNIHYLPLAAPDFSERKVSEEDVKTDISFFGSILSHEKREQGPLSDNNNLKDATKGYLAGCIACYLQTKKLPPIGSKLPEYVWEDLKKIYPLENQNSLESWKQQYANLYFNDAITYDSRIFYLQNIANTKKYKRINHYSRYDVPIHKEVKSCGWMDFYEELPAIAQNSKLNLVLSHYGLRAGIPAMAWGIMAAGGFLLANEQADYAVLKPAKVILFGDVHEMRQKAEYYYNNEEERTEIVNTLSEEIARKHTYRHRIEEMLSVLSK